MRAWPRSRLICGVCVIARIFVFADPSFCPDKRLFVCVMRCLAIWKTPPYSSEEGILFVKLKIIIWTTYF
jgi:hypothetical protein